MRKIVPVIALAFLTLIGFTAVKKGLLSNDDLIDAHNTTK